MAVVYSSIKMKKSETFVIDKSFLSLPLAWDLVKVKFKEAFIYRYTQIYRYDDNLTMLNHKLYWYFGVIKNPNTMDFIIRKTADSFVPKQAQETAN